MDAFGIVLFLAVITAAWGVDQVGISMTLGAFLMGMLLSASDYRYQIEAIVAPFKGTLMGLFFIAVGMSIDVGALLKDWSTLLVHIPVVLLLKLTVLSALALAFGISRGAAIRTGFYLSQVGEFAFVLLGSAAIAGLLSAHGHTLAMLMVSVTMILTPLMVKAGDRLARRARAKTASEVTTPTADLDKHVVVIGYDGIGELICLMLDKAKISHVAFDRDIDRVQQGKQAGANVHFGDMYSSVTQQAAGLEKAVAAYISMRDMQKAKALAVTLHRLYPLLNIYLRVATLRDQDDMVAKGIKHAATGYIESTLMRGSQLLKDVGVSEVDVAELAEAFRRDNYALVRTAYAKISKQPGS
jgi:glutathione-regulated potassium-efflux system protein KefB